MVCIFWPKATTRWHERREKETKLKAWVCVGGGLGGGGGLLHSWRRSSLTQYHAGLMVQFTRMEGIWLRQLSQLFKGSGRRPLGPQGAVSQGGQSLRVWRRELKLNSRTVRLPKKHGVSGVVGWVFHGPSPTMPYISSSRLGQINCPPNFWLWRQEGRAQDPGSQMLVMGSQSRQAALTFNKGDFTKYSAGRLRDHQTTHRSLQHGKAAQV